VNVNHDAGDVALHVHSRATETLIEEVPPLGGNELAGVVTVAWHRAFVPGLVTLVEAELPQASDDAETTTSKNSRGARVFTSRPMQKSRPRPAPGASRPSAGVLH
jgi:hypothetical protein